MVYITDLCKYLTCRETVQLLLSHGANVNMADSMGMTALYWAVKNGSLELVHILLENKADVNVELAQRSTVLHTATHADRPDIVKVLLENNANSLERRPCLER